MVKISQTQELNQKLSPQQILQAKLFQLNSFSLEQRLYQEMERNPLLELSEPIIENDENPDSDLEDSEDFEIEELYSNTDDFELGYSQTRMGDSIENINSSKNDIVDDLKEQIKDLSFNSVDFKIATEIVENLDSKGYLSIEPILLADRFSMDQNHVINSVKEFSKEKYKVDIFKLESPVDSNQLQNSKFNKATEDAFKQLSRATRNIPWVMLSSGMSKKSFLNCLKLAYKNGASGYLAGRTIWLDAFKDYPNYKKITSKLSNESARYVKKLNELTNKNAQSLEKYLTEKLIQKNSSNFKNIYKGF